MSWDLPSTAPAASPEQTIETALVLVVVSGDKVSSYPLPARGKVGIGRADDNLVILEDPQISRHHARVHLGPKIKVEDLGGRNGTRLRGELLVQKRIYDFRAGDVLELGTIMVILQARQLSTNARRLLTHTELETHLEAWCSQKSKFAILRAHLEGEASAQKIETTLTGVLAPNDLVALYAEGEYEILIGDRTPAELDSLLAALRAAAEENNLRVVSGVASYPSDGTTAGALIERACARVRGGVEDRGNVVIEDRAMIELYRVLDRVARGQISVLLLGETGVGKEVVASALHARSRRAKAPFVRLNCAALSESLLESELFGYEKGAFTGADAKKLGLLAAADEGTVFLDELGEMPIAIQAKLLRAIEQREICPLGSVRAQPIDVRFVSASNRNLEEAVERGLFRADLYYRLNGVALIIPPLRERRSEIRSLARRFAEKVALELGLEHPPAFSDRATAQLEAYRWPGNIRELRNVVERAVLLCSGEVIEPEHLPLEKLSAGWRASPFRVAAPVEDPERDRILRALEEVGGNQSRAAELLGISRRTLSKRLDLHSLPRPKKRDR